MTVVEDLRAAVRSGGDPERAAQQQAYMKSEMPYRGLSSPELTVVLRPVLAAYLPADADAWEADVRSAWDGADYREDRYGALALARHRRAAGWRTADCLPLASYLVTTGAWWDVVDDVATHVVRDALDADPVGTTPVVAGWAQDEDLWLRRTAVICQVGRKDRLDRDLLELAIEANLADTSFWLRKAIGWALRDHAHTDPDWVRAYVEDREERLSGLSRREALKNL